MLIDKIKSPADLKNFTVHELKDLAGELRETIIQTVATNGGHLASNLGTVDLTIALHYVFNSPEDKFIWDVGHQAYTHKLLTGRSGVFSTVRKHGGISGFPKISESPHDAFGTGHSSTSISAALGILAGRDHNKKTFKVIPVIGDGAMTAGLAFEGLNHAGHLKKDLIVILNDNEMSISPNVGALSAYLQRILMGDLYTKFKKETKNFLERIPGGEPFLKIAQKAEDTVKGLVVPGLLFEELGFEYVGPVDGHKIESMIEVMETFKDFPGPVLIHTITKKGKGYEPAEKNPGIFHGVGPFNIETGAPQSSSSSKSYSEIFGSCLTKLAADDDRIIAITAAMTEGTGLSEFVQTFPKRFYDVGIAEPHAATFAAGLATQGLKPVVAIYSTFLQRSYDEIIHDICLQDLPVVFAIDRAGIVGDDGPTHNGTFDLSYLRHIPNLIVMAPKDGHDLKCMLKTALSLNKPVAIRYPRGSSVDNQDDTDVKTIPLGKSEVLTEGKDILIIAAGNMADPAVSAAALLAEADIHACVLNARFIKPLDIEQISHYSKETKHVLTVEENVISGGFGSAVMEELTELGIAGLKFKLHGLPDKYIEQGPQNLLRQQLGLDAEGIAKEALALIGKKTGTSNTLK